MATLSRLQEMALIARCIAADDRNAFGQLVVAYADDIRRLLDRLTCGKTALVDDLAQETFVKAYLSIRSFKGVARFRTWLFRIAYNEFINHCRKEKILMEEDVIGIGELPDDTYDEELDSVYASLDEALNSLPHSMKAMVQLYYYDGFSVSQIDEILRLPSGTVKSYLHRARKRLAGIIRKDLPE